MGSFLKILFVIILLIIIAAIALPFFIDPNDFKPQIQTVIKEKTGRNLSIEGDLELSIFPWLGVSTGNLTLSNAPGFSDKPFAKIDACQVKVKIIPLLSKKLEVSRIELIGLNLNLAKNKQGITNWDDLIKSSNEEKKPATQTQGNIKKENPLAAFALGGIAIEQAHITWDDQQQGKYSELNDFNLSTDELVFNQPIDVELSFNLNNKNPDLSETLNFSTQLTVNEQLNMFDLKAATLKSLTTGDDIPGGKLTLNLLSDIAVDLVQNTVSISGLKLDLDDVTAEKIKVTLLSDIAINLTEQSINTTGLKIKAGNILQNKLSADLSANLAINLNQQTLSVSDLKLNAGELQLTANIKGTQIKDNPSFNGPINITSFNLAKFLKSLDIAIPETQDAQALNQFSTAFNLQATTNSADIKNLLVKLDDTNIKGSASIHDFSKPAIKFDIKVDTIDADRYLSPKKDNEPKTVSTPSGAAVATAELFPVEMLRNLNANGQINIGDLTINQLKMQGIRLKLNAAKGVIKTQQGINKLYQGAYSGNSSINVQNKLPQLSLNEKLSNIQVEPLLKALDITERMTGLINASIKVIGRGNSTQAIKSSLNGDVDFSFKDSIIKGFNLQKLIDSSKSLLANKALPTGNKKDQTVFSIIKGTAQINNGIINNNDLLAQSSKVQINGSGTANLSTEALKYKINTKVLKRSSSKTEAEEIRGIPLAINIGGNFSKPTYSLDLETMVRAKYQGKIDKTINKNKDKLLEKLDEKLGPGVSDALKNLF